MSDAVLTVEQMHAAEQAAMASGVSEWELMRRAGEGAAQYVARVAAGRSVTVLCGPGNNGGDGYVIAESLRRRGNPVRVIAPWPPRRAAAQMAAALWQGKTFADGTGTSGDVLVDALFGYGLTRPLDAPISKLLQRLASNHSCKIAIDVPSSVFSDSGEMCIPHAQYKLTLALGAWKPAHFLMPSAPLMGELRLVDIGIVADEGAARLSARPRLEAPEAYAHKYRRGLVAVVSGAMPGAGLLAAEAARRAGAGYVKLLGESADRAIPAGLVAETDVDDALHDRRNGAVLFGPGAGRDAAARARLGEVLETRRPTVLDADALHLLDPDVLEGADTAHIIVTPHEGELAALARAFGLPQTAKPATARALHEATGLTVLAKGPDTILAGAGGQLRYFPRGSSWLSVAGSGDVLAGAIAARLAAHGDPFRACEEGVWLHHRAARIAGTAFTPEALADAIRPAFESFL